MLNCFQSVEINKSGGGSFSDNLLVIIIITIIIIIIIIIIVIVIVIVITSETGITIYNYKSHRKLVNVKRLKKID